VESDGDVSTSVDNPTGKGIVTNATNTFSEIYREIDRGFGGILPGGSSIFSGSNEDPKSSIGNTMQNYAIVGLGVALAVLMFKK